MYGNYNIPNMYPGMMSGASMMSSPVNMMNGPMMGNMMMPTRGMGMMGRAGLGSAMNAGTKTGLLSGIKNFSFGNLLSGASKTLGVINQAIPVVREIGPMFNNMRSMIKVASVFKDETDNSSRKNLPKKEENTSEKANVNNDNVNDFSEKVNSHNNEPNFFV